MRILFVTASFLPQSIGGVELHVLGIARALRGRHEASVFCRQADPTRPELSLSRDEYDGITVRRLNYLFSDCVEFPLVYRNPSIRARFVEVLDEVRPDVVHVHHLTCLSTDLIDAARERGARVVMTLHDFWMGCPRGQRMTPELHLCHDVEVDRCAVCIPKMWGGWFGRGRDGEAFEPAASRAKDVAQLNEYHEWIRAVLSRCDRLVAPSESSREIYVRYGVPVERITVVENGLDHAPFRSIERTTSASFRFGFIGSVLPTKGVHVLIEAFERLGRPNARLDVHGELLGWHEVQDYGDRIRAQAERAGGRITLHGRYEAAELPSILGRLDALVVPSLWFEAFCLTLREGFLAGVPVIASRLGAMAEGIDDERTGLLFEPGNAADLAAKMARVMDDGALRARLVGSTKRVRTIEENAAALLTLYVGGAGGRPEGRSEPD